MRLTIKVDAEDAHALALIPEGSMGTYGNKETQVRIYGCIAIDSPQGPCLVGGSGAKAWISREMTAKEAKARRDAEHFDEEFS